MHKDHASHYEFKQDRPTGSPPGNRSTFIKVRTAVNEILIEFQVRPNRWTTFFDFLQFSFFFTKRNASAGFGTFQIFKISILFVFSPHLNAFLGCPAANSMIPLNKGSWACDKNKQNAFSNVLWIKSFTFCIYFLHIFFVLN